MKVFGKPKALAVALWQIDAATMKQKRSKESKKRGI
jgi:hypothetical protein